MVSWDPIYIFTFIYYFYLQFSSTHAAFDVPCTQKLVGSKCLFDEECYGVNTVCKDGRCSCPTNFEEYDVKDKITVCRLAPSNIGDSCQRDCKPPLLCRDGKCECWGGSVINGKCTVPCPPGQQLYGVECTRVAHWGQQCEKDTHCIDPFTSCLAGTCQCTPGTARDVMRNKCFAVCPDGMHPHQSCRRLFLNDIDMLDNAATTDSCPLGFRCVTYGSPYIGHCCRLRCPYGEPDLSQSCDNSAPEDQKCRPLTHFCFGISEPGWKTSLCCPRPCRDPTPLYINGQCLSIAHRDDPCQTDEQCEGGVSMSCTLGTCECRPGYHAVLSKFPTCEKTCNGDLAVIDKCLSKNLPLGARCFSNKQCSRHAECRFGTCECMCGYRQADSILGLVHCLDPDDPYDLRNILNNVENIFGSKSRGFDGP
uniref:EB domain-containing protein n=1 Tax=Panagrolaimus sp. JU765 TaxID=591449 RepID=A0AC34PUV8_9BILA